MADHGEWLTTPNHTQPHPTTPNTSSRAPHARVHRRASIAQQAATRRRRLPTGPACLGNERRSPRLRSLTV